MKALRRYEDGRPYGYGLHDGRGITLSRTEDDTEGFTNFRLTVSSSTGSHSEYFGVAALLDIRDWADALLADLAAKGDEVEA